MQRFCELGELTFYCISVFSRKSENIERPALVTTLNIFYKYTNNCFNINLYIFVLILGICNNIYFLSHFCKISQLPWDFYIFQQFISVNTVERLFEIDTGFVTFVTISII